MMIRAHRFIFGIVITHFLLFSGFFAQAQSFAFGMGLSANLTVPDTDADLLLECQFTDYLSMGLRTTVRLDMLPIIGGAERTKFADTYKTFDVVLAFLRAYPYQNRWFQVFTEIDAGMATLVKDTDAVPSVSGAAGVRLSLGKIFLEPQVCFGYPLSLGWGLLVAIPLGNTTPRPVLPASTAPVVPAETDPPVSTAPTSTPPEQTGERQTLAFPGNTRLILRDKDTVLYFLPPLWDGRSQSWRIEILNASGILFTMMSRSGQPPPEIVWNCMNSWGQLIPRGQYQVIFTFFNSSNRAMQSHLSTLSVE